MIRSSVFHSFPDGTGLSVDLTGMGKSHAQKNVPSKISLATAPTVRDGLAILHLRLEMVYTPVRVDRISERFLMGLFFRSMPRMKTADRQGCLMGRECMQGS